MRKSLLLAWCIAVTIAVNAQWIGDPALNNLVSGTSPTTTKTGNVAVSDGAGGMFLAWIDTRTTGIQSIYVQRILADGSLKFGSEVLITDAAGVFSSSKSSLSIDADGVGGVIMAWQDARNQPSATGRSDMYGQRINGDGVVQWTAGGARLTVSDITVSNKLAPTVVTVNATEAIVVYVDNRLGTNDVFAQKLLLSTGAPQWGAEVGIHGAQDNSQTSISALADGVGGAFVIWQDPRLATTNSDIYTQRINNAGSLLWGASGMVVCNAVFNQLSPQLVSDGAGGFVATWQDNRVATADGDIWAQRINGTGAAQWASNGVAICIQAGTNQNNPVIIAGGSGYIISWLDPRAAISNRNLYANSIDNNGVTQWTTAAEGGKVICTATGHQPGTSTLSGLNLVPDGSNGAIFIWDDARAGSSELDVYAQRVNSAGTVQWAADGILISSANGNQATPVSVTGLLNSVIIAWRDGRNGTANTQLFASQLLISGVLPVTFVNIAATLSNDVVTINWQTATELNANNFIVQRSEDGNRFYAIGTVKASGLNNSRYSFADTKPVSGTVYYRVQSIDHTGISQYSTIARVTAGSLGIFVNVYPVPSASTISVQFGNFTTGMYQLQLTDAKGSIVQKQLVAVSGNSFQASMNINNLQPGNYFIQVLSTEGKLMKTTLIQKL